jgi:octaprenyl-diphosphate synthase
MTLPIICTLKHCDSDEASLIREAIMHGNTDRLDDIVAIVKNRGGLVDARRTAAAEAHRAIDAARALPPNQRTEALVQLAAALLERRS